MFFQHSVYRQFDGLKARLGLNRREHRRLRNAGRMSRERTPSLTMLSSTLLHICNLSIHKRDFQILVSVNLLRAEICNLRGLPQNRHDLVDGLIERFKGPRGGAEISGNFSAAGKDDVAGLTAGVLSTRKTWPIVSCICPKLAGLTTPFGNWNESAAR